jgi:hypothetical protein
MAKSGAPEKRKFTVLSPVGRAVRPLVTKLLPKTSASFSQLFEVWPDLVAGTEGVGSLPEKLVFARGSQKDGILYLWATTSAQAVELSFAQATFIKKINALFGFELVRELRVTAFPKTVKESPPRTVRRGKVSCQSLDKDLSGISNPALKSILVELGGVLSDGAITDTSNEESHA